MKLYNYLTRKVEEFTPISAPNVGMYTCGPTTYDFVHIGNLRTFVFEDILQRVLERNGYSVKRVMNVTDIDDKIIKGAKVSGLTSIEEFSKPFEKAFFEDLRNLNIKSANVYPKATEHVGQMIKYIQELLKKDLAYIEKDGSVYFDISEFPGYGTLSQIDKRNLKTGTRILSDEYSKDDIQDFALWKSVEADEVGYDSPWGRGRPGWHIECSVMSQEYLGDSLDIHGGGVDLIFPHHENEIAQSEGKTGKKFSNFFVEGEHLLVEGKKMAKSAGNFYKLKDLKVDPLALRYLFLTAHYRDQLNFTQESLSGARNALNNLREIIRQWDEPNIGCVQFEQDFMNAINNDLNMPQAVAIMWDMIKSDNPTSSKAKSVLEMDKILGFRLDLYLGKSLEVSENVKKLMKEREVARNKGDFKGADTIRDKIIELGYEIEDTPTGPRLKNN